MLLLHLSDTHFRLGEVGTAMDPNRYIRQELLRDAEQMCNGLGVEPAAVLISGDLAFAGHSDEYKFALGWLEELCTRCGTTLASVLVIPGNHDIVRTVTFRPVVQSLHREIKAAGDVGREGVVAGLLRDPESGGLLYQSIEAYNLFAGQFFCDLLPPERTRVQRDLTLNDGSILRLIGLNSTFVSSSADQRGDLFLDPASFQISRERGVEHLVMCHHPYEWLRDGDRLKDHLNDVAKIHLFGHEHTSRIEMGRDWVRVAASAAHPDRTERGWQPGYNLLEVGVDGAGASRALDIRLHIRVWQQRPGQFVAKMDRLNDSFRQSLALDAWMPPAGTTTAVEVLNSASASASGQGASCDAEPGRSDSMNTLRDVSIRFFKLTLSQKSAIAGKLGLFEDEDMNQPDFERFRRVFMRARQRGLVDDLDREITAASVSPSA